MSEQENQNHQPISAEMAGRLVQRLIDGQISEHSIAGFEMIDTVIKMLLAYSDKDAVKNYVEMHMVGVPAPFDRVSIAFHRPGGKTPHELRTAADEAKRAIDMRIDALHALVDQTDPHDPVGIALTTVGLTRVPSAREA